MKFLEILMMENTHQFPTCLINMYFVINLKTFRLWDQAAKGIRAKSAVQWHFSWDYKCDSKQPHFDAIIIFLMGWAAPQGHLLSSVSLDVFPFFSFKLKSEQIFLSLTA